MSEHMKRKRKSPNWPSEIHADDAKAEPWYCKFSVLDGLRLRLLEFVFWFCGLNKLISQPKGISEIQAQELDQWGALEQLRDVESI